METYEDKRRIRVHRNVIRMIRDRGYNITKTTVYHNDNFKKHKKCGAKKESKKERGVETNLTPLLTSNTWYTDHKDRKSLTFSIERNGETIFVVFIRTNKGKTSNKETLQILCDIYLEYRPNIMISVSRVGYHATPSKVYEVLRAATIELYRDLDFAFNIPNHSFSPIQTLIIPPERKKEYSEKERIIGENLAMIKLKDPYSKYFKISKGSIITALIPGIEYPSEIQHKIVVN